MLTDERVARLLHASEEAVEMAYQRCLELGTALIMARSARNLSRSSGHQILASHSRVLGILGDGQDSLAGLHRLIERFGRSVGVETTSYGDGGKTGDDQAFGGA